MTKQQRAIIAITKRELLAYFYNPVAYIATGLFLGTSAFLFFSTFFLEERADMQRFFSGLPITLAFFIPALTMKQISEERKSGSLEVLLTMPVTYMDMIIAKASAAFITSLIMLLPTLFFVLTASLYGKLDGGIVLFGYIGAIFLTASFTAIGICASAASKSQTSAFLGAFSLCMVLSAIERFSVVLPPFIVKIMTALSAYSHFKTISAGIFDSRDFLYFCSITVIFIILSYELLKIQIEGKIKISKLNIAIICGIFIINLFSSKIFIREDFTSSKAYALSAESTKLIKKLEQPLSVEIFFSPNLPYPYNNTEQYLRNLMYEYKLKGKKNFSYAFKNMKDSENESHARALGIEQIPIQEVKTAEVGIRQAWLGIALRYGGRQEIINAAESAAGLEYKITSKIKSLVSADVLLKQMNGNANLTLYYYSGEDSFRIIGMDGLPKFIRQIASKVNSRNQNKINFIETDTSTLTEEERLQVSERYDLPLYNNKVPFGLTLEYAGKFARLPLKITKNQLGSDTVTFGNIEKNIEDTLLKLASKTFQIGYVTGHGEPVPYQKGSETTLLQEVLSENYVLSTVSLTSPVTSEMTSLIINSPKTAFSEQELFNLDQFLLRGGNVSLFIDAFQEVKDDEEQAEKTELALGKQRFEPIDTNLERLLESYGIQICKNYVLDENCFIQKDKRYGLQSLFFAPLLKNESINQKHPITKNIVYMPCMQNSSINIVQDTKKQDKAITLLLSSSNSSWLMNSEITTNPFLIKKPEQKTSEKSEALAVISEGIFESAFEHSPCGEPFIDRSIKSGRLFVTGSSKLLSSALLKNPPNAIFIRNIMDYMNGEADMCLMRTKGLSTTMLEIKSSRSAVRAKWLNIAGLPVLVAVAGYGAYILRRREKQRILQKYLSQKVY